MFTLNDDATFPTAEMTAEDGGFQELARRDVTPEYREETRTPTGSGGIGTTGDPNLFGVNNL